MLVKTEEEKRIARELRQKAMAENAARRRQEAKEAEARVDKRFEETRRQFRKNVEAWNVDRDQASKVQTLRVHRDTLHRRVLWTSNDALDWRRRENGTYYLDTGAIDSLHKPLSLLLAFVKAEHKIAHDRAALSLRARQICDRAARTSARKNDEKISESAERPHTPELSA